MIRKLLLPALLVGLLGGCATAGYGYRDGYYYGQPSVEYRYHDYGYPYYPGYYGYYPYYGSSYYYPYYHRRPYYYYNPNYHRPRPRPDQPPRDDDDHDGHGNNPPPWRDPDLRSRRDGEAVDRALRSRVQPPRQTPAGTAPRNDPPRRESRNEGPRVREVLQRTPEGRRRSGENRER